MNILRCVCVLGMVAMLGGCSSSTTLSQATAHTREKLLKTFLGMSKEKVVSIVGTEPREFIDPTASDGQAIFTISNPYRLQVIQGHGKNLEVVFYVTDDKNSDGIISDEELTPLIFDDGKMIGWGWSYLVSDKQKFEITIK